MRVPVEENPCGGAVDPYYSSAAPQVRERVIYGPARKVEKKPVEAQKPAEPMPMPMPMEEPTPADPDAAKSNGEGGKSKLVPRDPPAAKEPTDDDPTGKPKLNGEKNET